MISHDGIYSQTARSGAVSSMSACCTVLDQYPRSHHIRQIRTYLTSRLTHLERSARHCSVSIVVHQQFVVAQGTVTWVRPAVTLVRKDLQVAEPAVKSLKDLWARLAVTTAEVDVCRLSSYYSWQCPSLDHRPHTSPHHCRDSPLPCTETDSPPGAHIHTHTYNGTYLTVVLEQQRFGVRLVIESRWFNSQPGRYQVN